MNDKTKTMNDHLKILKYSGVLLVIVGAISLARGLDHLLRAPVGLISFNITGTLPLLAGIFLIRGSLRVAGWVWWGAALFVPLCIAWCAMNILVTPPGLILAQLRLSPGALLWGIGYSAGMTGSLIWLVRSLRCEAVLQARLSQGLRLLSLRAPVVLGCVLSLPMAFFLLCVANGPEAQHAKAIACQNLGPAYQYFANSQYIRSGPLGKNIAVNVVAYNDREMRMVPVQWCEARAGAVAQTQTSPNLELPATGQDTWRIGGTDYRIEGTAIITLANGDLMPIVKARCDFVPGKQHEALARPLAKYAVDHGYTIREASNNGLRQQVSPNIGIAFIYKPDPGSGRARCWRYSFDIQELRCPQSAGTLALAH
ncbi:MAG: hypothetical protein C5B50_06835 [Verrucomicrobia bacterium]|nr:MAG: hypothetical protein C5B50_06835 [Verrucomicrobiota bacterium]